MSVLYIVLPLAILLAIAAVLAFSWAVRTGQMDDLQTPALRILHDDVQARTRRETPDAAPPISNRERLSSTCADTPHARARLSQNDE
jgi:cbb3-type cytochrome oxidase maturation protein